MEVLQQLWSELVDYTQKNPGTVLLLGGLIVLLMVVATVSRIRENRRINRIQDPTAREIARLAQVERGRLNQEIWNDNLHNSNRNDF